MLPVVTCYVSGQSPYALPQVVTGREGLCLQLFQTHERDIERVTQAARLAAGECHSGEVGANFAVDVARRRIARFLEAPPILEGGRGMRQGKLGGHRNEIRLEAEQPALMCHCQQTTKGDEGPSVQLDEKLCRDALRGCGLGSLPRSGGLSSRSKLLLHHSARFAP